MEVDKKRIFGCFTNKSCNQEIVIGYKNEELTIVFRTLDDLPTVKSVLRVNLNHVKKESSTGKCIGKSQILPDSDVFKRIFTFSDTEENRLEIGKYTYSDTSFWSL